MARRQEEGFTLIELMIVVAIIGILAAIAITIYLDLNRDAQTASEDGIISALSSAAVIYLGKNGTFPTEAILVNIVTAPVGNLSTLTGQPNIGHTVGYNQPTGCVSATTDAANHPTSHIHATTC